MLIIRQYLYNLIEYRLQKMGKCYFCKNEIVPYAKMNSEVTNKWWLKTRKCEIYIILGNYSYYIGYIMNLVVLIVPFIVYCVKMYVYKFNMRDKIWFICLQYQYLFI